MSELTFKLDEWTKDELTMAVVTLSCLGAVNATLLGMIRGDKPPGEDYVLGALKSSEAVCAQIVGELRHRGIEVPIE